MTTATALALGVCLLGAIQFPIAFIGGEFEIKGLGFLTAAQMHRMFGDGQVGRPLLYHGGTWATMLLLPWCVYGIVNAVESQKWCWSPEVILGTAAGALIITLMMHTTYLWADKPEGHIIEGKFTLPVLPQFLAMWMGITLALLLYLGTPNQYLSPQLLGYTSLAFMAFLLLGTHLVCDAIARWLFVGYFAGWYSGGNPLQNIAGLSIVWVTTLAMCVKVLIFAKKTI